jgi:hypothetical protein
MGGGTTTALRLMRQLDGVGRRIDEGIREVITTQSRWLFDLTRSRFQRLELRQDHRQALAFGRWTPLTDVRIEGEFLVVEPRHEHSVRAEISTHGEASDSEAPGVAPLEDAARHS